MSCIVIVWAVLSSLLIVVVDVYVFCVLVLRGFSLVFMCVVDVVMLCDEHELLVVVHVLCLCFGVCVVCVDCVSMLWLVIVY